MGKLVQNAIHNNESFNDTNTKDSMSQIIKIIDYSDENMDIRNSDSDDKFEY